MGRIRTIKPELFRHEGLFEAEQTYQLPLRLAFTGLLTCCDRAGRFRWRPRLLKLDVLPYDDVDFSRVLDALVACEFIVKYEVAGEWYGCIPSWKQHQQINNKESESRLPAPEEGTRSSLFSDETIEANSTTQPSFPQRAVRINHMCLTRSARVNDASNTRDSAPLESLRSSQVEGEREKERKGVKEKQAKEKNAQEEKSIQAIFDFWKITLHHPQAKLDKKRKAWIRQALSLGYSVSELQTAITGCSKTPHNLGDNERGERYDGLHVIFKHADNIERFIQNCHSPPTQKNHPSNFNSTSTTRSHHDIGNRNYTQTPLEDIDWLRKA